MENVFLKPCPFCGEAAIAETTKWNNDVKSFRVKCINPLCCQPVAGDYSCLESAGYYWNMRPKDKRKEDLLEDVHRLEMKIEELGKHLDEKDAIIRKQVLMLSKVNDNAD